MLEFVIKAMGSKCSSIVIAIRYIEQFNFASFVIEEARKSLKNSSYLYELNI